RVLAVLGQVGVRRAGGEVRDLGLIVDGLGREHGTAAVVPDHRQDFLTGGQLPGDVGGLGGIEAIIVGLNLEGDPVNPALCIDLIRRQPYPSDVGLPDHGVVATHRAHNGDDHLAG